MSERYAIRETEPAIRGKVLSLHHTLEEVAKELQALGRGTEVMPARILRRGLTGPCSWSERREIQEIRRGL